jgi:hypothetical protein
MEIHKYNSIEEANAAIRMFERDGFNVIIKNIDNNGVVYIIIDGYKKFKK